MVESDYGYHIIKCVKALDEEATQLSEENAIQTKKNEEYSEMLQSWVDEIDYTISDTWKNYVVKSSSSSTEDDLADILSGEDTDQQSETTSETTAETATETQGESVQETESN